GPLEALGPVSRRAAVGHSPGGLLPPGDGLGVLSPRPRTCPRVSLGRGRPPRPFRQSPARLLCRGALERARPHPQGAPLRPDRTPGEPRRGREGVLLLPRRHTDPLIYACAVQVLAAGVPVRVAARGESAPRTRAPGVRASRHRDLRRRSLL